MAGKKNQMYWVVSVDINGKPLWKGKLHGSHYLRGGPKTGKSFGFQVYEFACSDGTDIVFVHTPLLNKLWDFRQKLGVPFNLNSAFRTIKYNTKIGGSPKSQHMEGRALDILLPRGYSMDKFYQEAYKMGFDGLGRYYKDKFLHVDMRGWKARWIGN